MKTIAFYILRVFYRNLKGANPYAVLGTVFFLQKIIGFNRMIKWPVHYTSRVLYPNNIHVGVRSFPGWSQGCYIQGRNGILIGDNLRMGPNVGLISANHSAEDFDKWNSSTPIQIGNNVWIGMNSVVMPGIIIEDNVIIGANSVVTKNIPSNCIAAGNPCKVIKEKNPYLGIDYSNI